MSNEDGTVWVTFNGEIYNHADLRPGLEARGHRYRSRCDTETILHLYEELGERTPERLRGMFAFAIWDQARQRLLLARDRLGIKPLYYVITDRELVFASEIKALLVAGAIAAELNLDALPELLATRFISGEETLFRGVRKLLPGHTLLWSRAAGVTERRYWTLPDRSTSPGGTFSHHVGELRGRLDAAVRRHLMSDVPLGMFLSGGIDSSALAALTARAVPGRLQTFSVGFAEQEANELPYARLAADAIGAEHREVIVTPRQYFDALPRLVWQEDEPIAFTSSVPLYFVSKLAQNHVKVVLTGEGADELFLGYNRYRVTWWNGRLGRPYWSVAPSAVQRRVRSAVGRLPRQLRRYASRSFLAYEPGMRNLFFENFAVFPDRWRRRLLADSPGAGARDPYAVAMHHYDTAQGGPLDRMSQADLHTYLHELLMKQDQMSMAASIESRVPFLDDDLIEYVSLLPGEFKVRGWETKALLRAAVADLVPPPILTRKKMGFPVPLGNWLGGAFWPIVDEFVLSPRTRARGLFHAPALSALAEEHRRGIAEHGDRLWLLINLEIWHRIFCDGESPSQVMRPVSRRGDLGRTGQPRRLTFVQPIGQPA
jgi:asparagine synthase (glutamine-hydrolysing)